MSNQRTLVRWIVGTALLLIIIISIGMLTEYRVGSGRILSAPFALVAIVSFAGFFRLGHLHEGVWGVNEAGMRTAIEGATVTVYLILVSMVAFFTATPGGEGDPLPKITETMIQSFTSLTSIVVAFYFGSSAAVAMAGKQQQSRDGRTGNSNQPEAIVTPPEPVKP